MLALVLDTVVYMQKLGSIDPSYLCKHVQTILFFLFLFFLQNKDNENFIGFFPKY